MEDEIIAFGPIKTPLVRLTKLECKKEVGKNMSSFSPLSLRFSASPFRGPLSDFKTHHSLHEEEGERENKSEILERTQEVVSTFSLDFHLLTHLFSQKCLHEHCFS